MNLLEAYIVMFIASFCTLVIEMVAGRILAPFVGVSIYTWTSIIGVILAGISIGAYIGGKLIDKFPVRKTLGWLLLLSGISALTIIPLTNLIAAYRFNMPLMMRIFLVTAVIFFLPGCILGTVSPVVVRLTLKNLENAGNVIGKIYAVSTLGAIIGTFATGFLFISWMGTRSIILTMAIILILLALFCGALFKTKKALAAFIVIAALCIWGVYAYAYKIPSRENMYLYKESDYYTIKLLTTTSSDQKTPLQAMVLDNLIHSYVCLENPFHIEYEYERIYSDVLKWKFRKNEDFKSLTIGGGGYTFPRYMELFYPNAQIDVVEIDPEVTKIVYNHLGLSANTRIKTYNTDGRWFVMNCPEKYDLIFTDAYNDLSIPYHLTTKEFAMQLKSIMKPDALLMSNIIDNFQVGAFLPSYIRTLREVFGHNNVYLLSVSPDFENTRISTFIVIAGNGKLDIKDFDAHVKSYQQKHATSVIVPDNLMEEFMTKRSSIIIRDDYAPVDNLIAPIFEERFGYNRKS
ncbi:MAG TPA: fused MFS/spermidine synthase [Syntrophorhabdus sp.]|nr:fused MFS/spermidine synthase [Syntrophorhabdus sp.]HQP55820.1 fused MFS/spermidine synthase [Syntrophorhabdus sp.]